MRLALLWVVHTIGDGTSPKRGAFAAEVERLWARLKEWRAVATRYEKTANSFTGALCMAAAIDWIKG